MKLFYLDRPVDRVYKLSQGYILFNHSGENLENVTQDIMAGKTHMIEALVDGHSRPLKLKDLLDVGLEFDINFGDKKIFSSSQIIDDDDLLNISFDLMFLSEN